ncbi:transport permease protein [Actinoplanes philippinensis]|uniref:Transport permease protein n=1 Tax=Actinoplanes philippinensis TaxID=35752 RepID=A0A1I2BVX0_9ACTN|nr:ABC transporter permease [Actinoplanes philippinensis]GIE76146.1 transport permease protein [Actinoplanes philippinensis]SFE60269.1 oleandomycin transport system permease protein [Actinoplanes philippinensis]
MTTMALRNTATLAWRTLVQIKHNPFELFDFSVQPIMFLLLFTYVFGGAIADSPGEYLTYALPGIIVQNLLFATLNTGVGLNTDISKGVFDRLRSLPIARFSPLAGRIVADVIKQAWAIALLLVLGIVLGFRIETGPAEVLATFALLLGFAFAVSWMSVLVAMLVSEPEKVQIFGFVLLFPITFASGAFVDPDTMPGWLRSFADVNPTSILADAARGLLSGGPVAGPVTQSLLWAAGFLVIFAPLSVRAFRRRI